MLESGSLTFWLNFCLPLMLGASVTSALRYHQRKDARHFSAARVTMWRPANPLRRSLPSGDPPRVDEEVSLSSGMFALELQTR